MKTLTKSKAVEAIRILDKHNNMRRNNVFQNKRKAHRDIKLDYLGLATATKISNALTRAGIPHRKIRNDWRLSVVYQIRLAVDLAFSLGDARRTIRGGKPLPQTKKLSPKMRFMFDKNAALKTLTSLKFEQHGAPRMLREITAALYFAERN